MKSRKTRSQNENEQAFRLAALNPSQPRFLIYFRRRKKTGCPIGTRPKCQFDGYLTINCVESAGVVPVASDFVQRNCGFEPLDFSFSEPDVDCCGVFFEVLAAFGSGDRDDVFALGQDPGEGELAGGCAFALCDCFQPFHQDHVLVKVLTGEPWAACGA